MFKRIWTSIKVHLYVWFVLPFYKRAARKLYKKRKAQFAPPTPEQLESALASFEGSGAPAMAALESISIYDDMDPDAYAEGAKLAEQQHAKLEFEKNKVLNALLGRDRNSTWHP
jgi:hypothetical protein